MRVICCRCEKWLSGDAAATVVSHGLCEACARVILTEAGVDPPVVARARAEQVA